MKSSSISARMCSALVCGVVCAGLLAGCSSEGSSFSSAAAVASRPPDGREWQLPFTLTDDVWGLAVRGSGDVYLPNGSGVLRMDAGSARQTEVPIRDLVSARKAAVDEAGNVYVLDGNRKSSRVFVFRAATGEARILPYSDFDNPSGIAVSAEGDVYVVEKSAVLRFAVGVSVPTAIPTPGIYGLGIAADASGHIYVSGWTDENATKGGVLRISTRSPEIEQTLLPFSNLTSAYGVAVDRHGDVYVADDNQVVRLPADSTTPVTLPCAGCEGADGVGVDHAGNVYVAFTDNDRVVRLARR